ncbi:MAG: hypothetical protein K2X98_04965 [Alphaproteobacteria bacterium]|nr:hypothetical protein [Alphaproteobacteria bacterium]
MQRDIIQRTAKPSKSMTKKLKKIVSWQDYLNDLDMLYGLALEKENITVALKIKEIQIKAHQEERENLNHFDLNTLSDAHLDRLIELIEGKCQIDEPESSPE